MSRGLAGVVACALVYGCAPGNVRPLGMTRYERYIATQVSADTVLPPCPPAEFTIVTREPEKHFPSGLLFSIPTRYQIPPRQPDTDQVRYLGNDHGAAFRFLPGIYYPQASVWIDPLPDSLALFQVAQGTSYLPLAIEPPWSVRWEECSARIGPSEIRVLLFTAMHPERKPVYGLEAKGLVRGKQMSFLGMGPEPYYQQEFLGFIHTAR